MNQGGGVGCTFGSGSIHRDVLEAPIPESNDGRQRLVTEIKNRGKAAVLAESWYDACLLYRKALDVLKSTTDEAELKLVKPEIAIISSNLALTEGKMFKWDESKTSSYEATVNDPEYVKGWWRYGQAQCALENYTESIQSFETALKLEPTNKALQKELVKVKDKQTKAAALALEREEEEKKKASESEASSSNGDSTTHTNGRIQPPPPSVVSQSIPSKPKTTTTKTTIDSSNDPMDVDTDGTEFTKSDHIKGYKIVNGKKTSFFHNELSKEARELIGDIAPKKLETIPDTEITSNGTTDGNATTTTKGSVWNKAGTWEERDVSDWATKTLQSYILDCTYTLPLSSPAPNAIVSITDAKVTGTASVASVRGKKRYIYEYNIIIHWKFDHTTTTTTTSTSTADGTITFIDIDGTCSIGDEYDVSDFIISNMSDPTVRPIIELFVHKQGLRPTINTAIDKWVRTLQDTY